MNSADTQAICPCGAYHPAGIICAQGTAMLTKNTETKAHTRSQEEGSGRAYQENMEMDSGSELPNTAPCARSVFLVADMDCPMEEALIRKKLEKMSGVLGLEFNLMNRTLKVRHESSCLPDITHALDSLHLGARLQTMGASRLEAVPEAKTPWKKLIIAGITALASELTDLTTGIMLSTPGIEAGGPALDWASIFERLPLVLAVIALALVGLPTYKKGWIALKTLNLNINALMSVAVTGAMVIGQYPEAAMVMVLFNLAEAIEAKSLNRSRNAIKELLNLAPEKATVLQPDGVWLEVDIRQVALGSRVRVRPGERVALDGVIVEGRPSINQAPITGESLPVEKFPGDSVFAGTINESGSFEFSVSAEAGNSTLARIIHAVEEAQDGRAPTQRFIDHFAKIYTPAVFLLAFLTALVPPLLSSAAWLDSIYKGLVILVIGCPCALVISTPVSIVSGMAAAARQGILIKGGVFLEQGRKLRWLALDKTGTITYGRPKQTDFIEWGKAPRDRAIKLAASLAGYSDHPASRAIIQAAKKISTNLEEVSDFRAIPGRGVSGVISGQKYWLGNRHLAEELGKCQPDLEEKILALEKQGKSVVMLIGSTEVCGVFAVADTIKESSVEAVRELCEMGIKTFMLTGDNEYTARLISEQAGIDQFKGNLLPADKLEAINNLARQCGPGKIGMAGDGINDAPALARADVGFAMGAAGSDTAIETADVALMDDDLRKIPRFIKLSKATHTILIQNISFALSIKALFFAMTFLGITSMWMAVFADMGASLLVVGNGLRAMRK